MDYEAVLILATLRESQAVRLQQNPPPTAIRGPGSGPVLGQSPAVAGGRTPQVPGDTPAARTSNAGNACRVGMMKLYGDQTVKEWMASSAHSKPRMGMQTRDGLQCLPSGISFWAYISSQSHARCCRPFCTCIRANDENLLMWQRNALPALWGLAQAQND